MINRNYYRILGTILILVMFKITTCSGDSTNASRKVVHDSDIHKCCEFQFGFHNGRCTKDSVEEKEFPEYFLDHRLTQSSLNCKEWERITLPLETLSLKLTQDGYFLHGQTYFPSNQYCFDSLNPTSTEVVVFKSSQLAPTIRMINKCCEMDYSYDAQQRKCFRSTSPWGRLKQNFPGRETFVTNVIPRCKPILNFTNIKFWDRPVKFDLEELESTGKGGLSLSYQSQEGVFLFGVWRTIPVQKYCIEQLQLTEKFINPISNLTNSINNLEPEIVFYCADDDQVPDFHYKILLGCMWIFISPLLAVAAFVNVFLVQRNVHGYVLFCYLLSSSFLNFIAGVFIMTPDDKKIGCSFLDFAQKFLYLSTLCWMTMMNFNLWWDFRKLEPNAKKSMKRLPCYIFITWAIPILIITSCWFIGTNKKTARELTNCVIYDYGLIFYSSGPVVLLILFNLILFIRTTIIIRGLRKETLNVLRHSRRERESFKLFAKLFLMTGPIWILRVILLVLLVKGKYLSWLGFLLEGIFVISDIIFFLLVVSNRKVVKYLSSKIPLVKGILCCPQPTIRPPELTSSARSSPKWKIERTGYNRAYSPPIGLYIISNHPAAAEVGPKTFV